MESIHLATLVASWVKVTRIITAHRKRLIWNVPWILTWVLQEWRTRSGTGLQLRCFVVQRLSIHLLAFGTITMNVSVATPVPCLPFWMKNMAHMSCFSCFQATKDGQILLNLVTYMKGRRQVNLTIRRLMLIQVSSDVDAILVKLLLFERCVASLLYGYYNL